MPDTDAPTAEAETKPTSLRTVITASSAGTTFEWYDFFVFGSLTGVISKTFFTGLPETAGFAAALALFGAGFLFRPLGALVFGRIGDRKGRKGAFLATVLLMGGATVAIGLLPSYTQAGIIGPILLILMRIIQGFALGGEYGGAAIYVAEHAPNDGRGQATSWIQSSAAFGLFGALIVILLTRLAVGNEAFDAWGWRIPFLFSGVLLAISIWMRVKLQESPEFARLKAEGKESKAPFTEAFGQWPNLKLVLIALVGVMFAQGAVWYTTFFYAQTFMERFLKVPPETISLLLLTMTVASAVLYVVFGWLSDRLGRKPVMMFGMVLMLVAYFPGFHMLTQTLNPALAQAGYPTKADPKRMNILGALGVMLVFVVAATALYGPIAAGLVELFPTHIRYTAMSLPYHIGTGWVGGFVPFTAFAIVTATGDLYSGLWYPFAFTALSVVVCFFLLPETKGRPLDR